MLYELTELGEGMEKKKKFNKRMNAALKRVDTGENKVQESEM